MTELAVLRKALDEQRYIALLQKALNEQGYIILESNKPTVIGEINDRTIVDGKVLKATTVTIGTATFEEFDRQHRKYCGCPAIKDPSSFFHRVVAE